MTAHSPLHKTRQGSSQSAATSGGVDAAQQAGHGADGCVTEYRVAGRDSNQKTDGGDAKSPRLERWGSDVF